uniref:Uncharacterized protein n=1 Tax=Brassica oleracea TaxID=3712 RepID=A0A3P6GC17_BRAOL|nr:unnamed protein product [Brassica oleracea]
MVFSSLPVNQFDSHNWQQVINIYDTIFFLSSRIYHEIYNDDLFGCFSN